MSVEIQKDNSLIISGFQDGIGSSTLSTFTDMVGVNIFDNQNTVSVNFKFNKIKEAIPAQTFTVTTDRVVTTNPIIYRGLEDYIPVELTTTGTLPTGLAVDTIYYLEKTGTNIYKLKPQIKGSGYTNITAGTGSGTHTITPITPSNINNGCWITNSSGSMFALDTNNRLWFCGEDAVSDPWYLIAGNTSNGYGNGLVFYKGYIIVFANSKMDALTDLNNPIADTIVWNNDFVTGTISASNCRPYLSTNDGSVYFINGTVTGKYHRIGMFEEVPDKTFDPTDSDTFSLVSDAVTIPFEDFIGATCIKEINEYLIIGSGSEKVYFWDKKSPSFTSFISLQEKRTYDIQVIDNLAYIFAGNTGSIYVANTASSSLLIRIPEYITNQYYNTGEVVVNSSCSYRREILFSVTIPVSSTSVNNFLMSYNLDQKKLIKKNISSAGVSSDKNGTFVGKISSVYSNDKNIMISTSVYSNSTSAYSYYVESLLYSASTETGTPTYYVYDNYEPNIVTGLIPVGQPFAKETFRELHASFLRNLATGQGIKVYYRYDDESAWVLSKTIDYTTFGAIKDIKVEAPIENIVDIQIKIELAGTNLTSPRLKFIRLIP